MATITDTEIQKIIEKIGIQVRELRNNKSKVPYYKLAEETLKINKNTYFRIEQGEFDYNISWLLLILKHHGIKPSKFFKNAGL